jgi:hypothetical protein
MMRDIFVFVGSTEGLAFVWAPVNVVHRPNMIAKRYIFICTPLISLHGTVIVEVTFRVPLKFPLVI